MKKVFVFPSWFFPYGGSFFLEQTGALKKISEPVMLFAEPISMLRLFIRPWLVFKCFSVETEVKQGVEIRRCYYINVPKIDVINHWTLVRQYHFLYKDAVLQYGKPDLIHVHSAIWAGLAAYFLKQKYGIPYVITEHRGRFTHNKYTQAEGLLKPSFNKKLEKFFAEATCICPVSKLMVDKINTYNKTNTPVVPIPNLSNEEFFYLRNKEKNKIFTFITVAGLFPSKAIDVLIEAFFQLQQYSEQVNLIIVGDGSEKEKLKQQVKGLGLEDKVFFKGKQDRNRVGELMSESHVFVLPTRFEAFAVVFVEALLSGLPIIGTRGAGGHTYIIEEGVNGFLVEIDSVSSITEAMRKSFENYRQFEVKKIAEESKRKFGNKAFIEAYEKIYDVALQRR